MNVVVDVLRTVAVIAVALGAVTKFLVGVVGVGLAADGALVDIALLLLGLLGGLLEVDGLAGGLVFDPAEELEEIVPEEDKVVQNGNQGDDDAGEGGQAGGKDAKEAAEDAPAEQGGVDPRQPLDLDGDDEEKKHLHVWIQGGEGKEQGEVHVGHAGGGEKREQMGGIERGGDRIEQETDHHVEQDTQAIEHIELSGTPLPLQH